MSAGKIMVVDDDSNICELLRLYLEKEDFEVVLAYNGEALEMFDREKPELILLDIMMPVLDGWQVCAKSGKINLPDNNADGKGRGLRQGARP